MVLNLFSQAAPPLLLPREEGVEKGGAEMKAPTLWQMISPKGTTLGGWVVAAGVCLLFWLILQVS
jgi:hypothetical protein